MTITFLCPNGHQLNAKEERAGKPGQCPKCGSKFVVPEPDESEEEHVKAPAAAEESPSSKGNEEPTITFLCPNGHQLHGPAKLQGRPGQCPHCNAKFLIPSYEDEAEEQEAETAGEADVAPEADFAPTSDAEKKPVTVDEIPVGTIVEEGIEQLPQDAVEVIEEIEEVGSQISQAEIVGILEPAAAALNAPHPLADLFFDLWDRRGKDEVVEVDLGNGKVLVPDRVSASSARGAYGIFGMKEDDGTFTITVVPWNAVTRVGYRKLSKLPKDLFD